MKMKELQEKSKGELEVMLREARAAIAAMRVGSDRGHIKRPNEYRDHKKMVARILTMVRAKD